MAKTKGAKSNKRELEHSAKAPPPAPKWPAFRPALPVTSLSLEEAHPAFRDKILLIDDFHFARRLWLETGLKDLLSDDSVGLTWNGEVVGLNPNIRVYRYSPNQFFDAHYDLDATDIPDIGVRSRGVKPSLTERTKRSGERHNGFSRDWDAAST
ncbi:hypothetical protein PG994_007602 [Apiospora phragmitis]|uniref:Uncharacterized protein n=1 Tax=Apiospora phragmitis TaxID=2905665 RepID=A0ABR1UT59_9PEZI